MRKGTAFCLLVILSLLVLLGSVAEIRADEEKRQFTFFPFVARSEPMGDFYVDNSGVDGDGSFGNPWNNIAGHVNDLAAGDTMHVRGNASAPARAYVEAEIDITVSGNVGNRITLRPYQNELVVIKPDGGHFTFDIHGTYWEIKNFEIDHDGRWFYGILVRGSHTIIRDCEIHNSHNHNIVVDSDVTDTEIRGNTMYNFFRVDADAHGVMVQARSDRTIIDGNTVYDCSGDCVQFHDPGWTGMADNAADCEVTNNHFYNTKAAARYEAGVTFKCSTDLLIANNVIHGFDSGRSQGGIACSHDQHAGTLTIRDNIIYDCRRGIRFADLEPTSIECYRNLIYDIDWEVIFVWYVKNLNLYNNTFANSPSDNGLRVMGHWTGGSLQNNLWDDCGVLQLDGGAVYAGVTTNHNGRWDTTSDAAFVDAPTDTTGIGDPGFVDEANDDYRLLVTSNAVDAGVNVGLPFHGPAPDLGYWEYGEGSTTSTTTLSTTSTLSITTTTTTLYDPYADALIINCATGLQMAEPLTVAEIIDRNAIAAAAQGF